VITHLLNVSQHPPQPLLQLPVGVNRTLQGTQVGAPVHTWRWLLPQHHLLLLFVVCCCFSPSSLPLLLALPGCTLTPTLLLLLLLLYPLPRLLKRLLLLPLPA
jgi:hypothetical protein